MVTNMVLQQAHSGRAGFGYAVPRYINGLALGVPTVVEVDAPCSWRCLRIGHEYGNNVTE